MTVFPPAHQNSHPFQKQRIRLSIGSSGADFLIANGNLYRYTGAGGNHWSWTVVRTVSYENSGTFARWTVARSDLKSPVSIKVTAKLNKPLESTATMTQTFQSTFAALPRNPLKWPFSSTSIWNMPIGSAAKYVPAKLPAIPSNNVWAPMPQLDIELVVLRPDEVKTPLYYNGTGWNVGNRCTPSTRLLASLPMPSSFLVANSTGNNGAAFLEADRRTMIQTQPLARCTVGGPATGLLTFLPVDLYSDGMLGAHGGSALSTLGGTLRIGELRPGGSPPRHTLKLNVDPQEVFYPCKVITDCYRWPSKTADAGAVGTYGKKNPFPNPALKMGSLLAIPASVSLTSLGLETLPAKQLAWTLQNFGIYIVDSTGGAAYAISAEEGPDGSFANQFKADWGFPIEGRVRDNTPWTRDFQKLITALHVVDNNTVNTIGGGGTPLQTLAPALP